MLGHDFGALLRDLFRTPNWVNVTSPELVARPGGRSSSLRRLSVVAMSSSYSGISCGFIEGRCAFLSVSR